ncbi:MAG: DNA polymerase III subunit gamma/tau [Clostridia bacterium]|nr:DNA polymerase III subunit gamma/tau [Clostridia bacterium]
MHQALYRKWRPQIFDDVYGQEHITSILKYETENHKFSHAYLFCGSRGTGKTTCAKILAKAVNCESPVNGSPCNRCASCMAIDSGAATDVLEMDAASNNGVENIRDIRDEVVYTPSSLKYRVYIVDEVHMLSGSAFNALLKTLEEPPSHVVFILATTELHKLPATIISRCQRFDFRRIATDTLVSRLSYIADMEDISAEPEALRAIAKLAQGGMRDAISLLELCAGNHTTVTEELVSTTVGSGGKENIVKVVRSVASADYDTVFAVIDDAVRSSKDITVFWQELISFYRDMLVFKTTRAAEKYLDLTDSERETLSQISALFTKETLLAHCRMLDDSLYTMQKAGAIKRVVAEMALIKMCDHTLDGGVDNILSRLSKLEMAIAAGGGARVVSEAVAVSENKSAASDVKKVPVAEALKKQSSPEPTPSSVAPARVIRGWQEIAKRTVGEDVYLLSFLKTAKGYVMPDGKVSVRFSNDFALEMVDRAGIKERLCSMLNVELQASFDARDISYEVSADKGESVSDDLDSFDM